MPEPVGRAIVLRSVGRSLHTSFDSISVAGRMPRAGAVLAATHGSWWDGYLLGGLAGSAGTSSAIMMTRHQLAAYPFLRLVGAVGPDGGRALVRAAARGQWAVIFPEGAIQPPGRLGPIQPGAAWIARTARVPLVPVAIRITTRGAPQPEALVRFGDAVDVSTADVTTMTQLLALRLQDEQDRLTADIAAADPERPISGYRVLRRGSAARRDSVGWSVRALAWLTGQPSVIDATAIGTTTIASGRDHR